MKHKTFKDTSCEIGIPESALWGKQTQLAIKNFPISSLVFPQQFIKTLAIIKRSAAKANKKLQLLDSNKANAIIMACDEIIRGDWNDQFPVSIYQTGSGTSTNMNINEVIANRATQILNNKNSTIHPNDDVNKCQSSNDVIPTAIHISSYLDIQSKLFPALHKLKDSLHNKKKEFGKIVKIGRTHLMDAMPVSIGQEFSGWEWQIKHIENNLFFILPSIEKLALGGTAVGTGINAHNDFASETIQNINKYTNCKFKETDNHFFSQSCLDAIIGLSSILKSGASAIFKIANDIRWLSSGPICGLNEINLPALQEGSSIMPGKVNPVISEAVMMACAQVIGYDTAISLSSTHANFQLITMMPLIAYNILSSIQLLSDSSFVLSEKNIERIKINIEQIEKKVNMNLMLATLISPKIGYDRASQIVKKAYLEKRSIKDVILEMTSLSKKEIDKIFDPKKMIKKGIPD